MTIPIVLSIIGTTIAIAAFLWQVYIVIYDRRTKIEIEANPTISPNGESWSISCKIINKSRHPVNIRRVHIENARISPWYVDLRPSGNEKPPVAVEAGSETSYTFDGEEAVAALGGQFSQCVCIVTTSGGKRFKQPLTSTLEFKCLVASLKVDDGSGSATVFPLPEDAFVQKATTRQVNWTINHFVHKGWFEKRISANGEVEFAITREGQKVLDSGMFPIRRDPNDLLRQT